MEDKLTIALAGIAGVVAFPVIAIMIHGAIERRHARKMGVRSNDKIRL